MSYILDALKKAESERERGLVPGLHAQPLSSSRPAGSGRVASKPFLWVLSAASLSVLVMAAVWWRSQAASPPPTTVVAMQLPTPASPVRPLPAIAAVNPARVVAASPTAPTAPAAALATAAEPALTAAPKQGSVMAPAQITPLPATALSTNPPPPKPSPAKKPEQKPARLDPIEPVTPVQAPAGPAFNAQTAVFPAIKTAPENIVFPPATAQSREPVNKLSELPADVRLAMPKLVITGSTYSDTPAYRMLIINGQVFHEGEKIAADMLLQQIRPNIAVLEYKGQRYSMPY